MSEKENNNTTNGQPEQSTLYQFLNDKPNKVDFSALAENWGHPFCPRPKIGIMSGGIVHPRHMANLDIQGKGIPDRIRVGRQIVYKTESVIAWLEARAEIVED